MQISVGLTFPGELQDESVICSICKNFDIELKIIEASFSMSSGWAILELDGDDQEIEKVFDFLSGKSIKIQKIKQGK